MSDVRFQLPGAGSDLYGGLPLTIVDEGLSVVAQTTLAAGAQLPPGRYTAQTILPSGEPLKAGFKIDTAGDADVAIGLRRSRAWPAGLETQLSPNTNLEAISAWLGVLGAGLVAASVPVSTIDLVTHGKVDLFHEWSSALIVGLFALSFSFFRLTVIGDRRTPLLDRLIPARGRDRQISDQLRSREAATGGLEGAKAKATAKRPDAKITIVDADGRPVDGAATDLVASGGDPEGCRDLTLRFARPGHRNWNVRLPVGPGEPGIIEYRSNGSKGWRPHIRLGDPRAELLLQYAASHETREFAQLAAQGGDLAREALSGPVFRRVLAILSGYALLRMGDLKQLESVSADLLAACDDSPDAQIIRAEHLARTARHQEALAGFLSATGPARPLLRLGLRLQLDRLTSYNRLCAKKMLPSPQRPIAPALAALEDFAACVDFDRVLLTWSTDAAGQPSPDPINGGDFRRLRGDRVQLGD